ncbi:hypothetical protein ACFL2Y_05115 [Candidatus Omnitrophota bacterium]
MRRWIGVDLHKTQFTVCYLHKNGEYTLKVFRVACKGMKHSRRRSIKAMK